MPIFDTDAAISRRPVSPTRFYSLGLPSWAAPTAGRPVFASYAALTFRLDRGSRHRLEGHRGGVKR